jgi:glyoxylase-like metal-dependent hydrolase (beta-lactamase superfamily II)
MSAKLKHKSTHFDLLELADGVFVCIHRPGAGALSNAGIIDLGDRTLVVDAMGTLAAGRDLRAIAEALFDRPVSAIVLTHHHDDHWIGASAFGPETLFLCTAPVRAACVPYGAELAEEYEDRAAWEDELSGLEERLATEEDECRLVGLRNGIAHLRITMAELGDWEPRYADATFSGPLTFHGSSRSAEARTLGAGHTRDDVAVILPGDGIAFLGDVGFFQTQPFLADCDPDGYRRQLGDFLDAGLPILVPGHGPVGGRGDVEAELGYLEVMESLIREVVVRGGSLDEAKRIELPAPFDAWLTGGMNRFAANVEFLYRRLGGGDPTHE